MKKLAYITLLGAFIFGVQPQEAFSNNDNVTVNEAAANGEARIGYDDRRDVLTLGMVTAGEDERAIVQVMSGKEIVLKESFLVSGRAQTFEIDLSDLAGGAYNVRVVSPSFKVTSRIKKK